MGKRLTTYEYRKYGASGLMKPVIFCYQDEELGKNAIGLNIRIAEKLSEITSVCRTIRLPAIINSVIGELPENSIIKDFDVLFNPEYAIDVLQLLIAACKKKEFAILWPGTYSDGKLVYAANGYPDYKIFDLDKYDVTYVI
jgi:hypothetical protein